MRTQDEDGYWEAEVERLRQLFTEAEGHRDYWKNREKKRTAALEAEVERLRGDVEAAQTLAGTYEEENERLRENYEAAVGEAEAQAREVERLRETLAHWNEVRWNQEAEAEAEVERLRAALMSAHDDYDEVVAEVERLRAENKELRFSEQLLEADYHRIEEAAREALTASNNWDALRTLRTALEERP